MSAPDYSHVYPEIAVARRDPRPELPMQCPVCGAQGIRLGEGTWRCRTNYACGGGYMEKPQIQNHTDKWWGFCPKRKALVESGFDALVDMMNEARAQS